MACTKSARYVHARLVLMQACTFLATRMLPDSRSTWLHTTGDSSRSQTPSVSPHLRGPLVEGEGVVLRLLLSIAVLDVPQRLQPATPQRPLYMHGATCA